MRILYFYRVPLPSARADAIQIVQSCSAMARAGARIALHVEETGGRSGQEILSWYGVEPFAGEEAGSLTFTPLGSHWSWPFLSLRTRDVFRLPAGERGTLFVREVRRYVPGLMKRARRAGLRTIFEAHNVSTSLALEKQGLPDSLPAAEGRARERHRLEREILSLTDALVCTQRETLDQLKPLLAPETPTIILGNGTRLAPAAPMAGKDIDVLYCGSLKEWKGVDTLVYAMQSLHPWVLTIVGPGTDQDLARLKALALALGVRERVRILPPVSPSEVWGLYGRARVGVIPLPSGASVEARSFTSPLKLFEMLAAGLPIVASRLPSLTEYIENDREALLVDPDDPRFLAFGIRRILTEETLSARLSEAARRRAAAFTWDERGRRLVEFARGLRS